MESLKNHADTLQNLKKADIRLLEDMLQEIAGGIKAPDEQSALAMQNRLDAKIKPLRSLGVLEDIARQLAGIYRTPQPVIKGKAVLLMAGDHGVVSEGVSLAPQEITAQMFYSI